MLNITKTTGVSLVSLVITIIVIIILASVALNSSMESITTASYSVYINNVAEVQQAFSKAVVQRRGKESLKGSMKEETQVIYAVANATEKYSMTSEALEVGYTIIKDEAAKELKIELPQMMVETDSSSVPVKVKYVVTSDGVVFAWPPIENNNQKYVSGNITSRSSGDSIFIALDNKTIKIFTNESDGTIKNSGD